MTKTQCNPVFLGRNTSTLVSTKIPVQKYYILCQLIKLDTNVHMCREKKVDLQSGLMGDFGDW